MRLTLRTLLAYLDDILDPTDAEQLGNKVRESDFASGLVHRIRSVTGRLRLSAPPVEGRGLGADANSVAEYLDNTLPADRIPEFEKVCLESDMHLSEVASCHQVLTLVLGEPAHVDLNLRNRIHNLPVTPPRPSATADAAPRSPERRSPGAVGAALDSKNRHLDGPTGRERRDASARPTRDSDWRGTPDGLAASEQVVTTATPDYVAAQRRSFPGWLAALLAGFLITAAVLVGVRGLMKGSPVPNEIAQGPTTIPPMEAVNNNQVGNNQPATGAQPFTGAQPVMGGQPVPEMPAHQTQPGAPMRNAMPMPPTSGVSSQSAVAPGSAGPGESEFVESSAAIQMPIAPPLAATETPAAQVATRGETPASTAVDVASPDVSDSTAEPNAATAAMVPASEHDEDAVATVEPSDGDEAAAVSEPRDNWPAPPQPKDLGRFASEDQVLAVWDDGQQAWQRLPARAVLRDGVHLRVPTLYRPNLMLGSGIHVTLNDRTDVRLEANEAGAARLVFGYGQAIFSTIGDTRTVALQISDQPVTVTFGDAQSQFALELQQLRLPGADPFQAGNTIAQARIWPTSGNLGVQVGDGPSQAIAAGKVWVLTNGAAVIGDVAAQPDWITVPKRREIDRQALAHLASTIKSDRSLTLELFEIVEHQPNRLNERRSLAARALASLGQFDPLIESFSDKRQHYAWRAHYEELLAGLAREPQSAERVREAANKYWGTDAARFLRMVVGYDPDRLRRVGAAELVAALSDEKLEARVIAIESLRQITDKSQLFFPERSSIRRREPTRKWQQLLESGEIVYQQWPPGEQWPAGDPPPAAP